MFVQYSIHVFLGEFCEHFEVTYGSLEIVCNNITSLAHAKSMALRVRNWVRHIELICPIRLNRLKIHITMKFTHI